jgi:Zn-dependent metalloprotease
MINPKQDIKRLESSKEYIEWNESNSKSYLSDFFCILDTESKDDNLWQIDFYNPEDDTMTSFELPADKRKKCSLKTASSKIFKEEKSIIEELSLQTTELTDKDAMEIAKEFLQENHKGENPTKTILILQSNKELKKVIWNLTFVTSALNMFNAKIDAKNGKILDSFLRPATSLRAEIDKK